MTITNEALNKMRERFISLITKINRPGADIVGLLAYLDDCDFYAQPSTTQYACSFEGGLLVHSLNTYDNMISMISRLAQVKGISNSPYYNVALKIIEDNFEKSEEELKDLLLSKLEALTSDGQKDFVELQAVFNHVVDNINNLKYLCESCVITGLLHDINKVYIFEQYAKNEKVYRENGRSSDNLGKFDWVSSIKYKYKDMTNRVIIGNHGFSSYYVISKYLPLTDQEVAALANQFTVSEEVSDIISGAINSYPLTLILHNASMTATYITDTFYVKE